MWDALTVERLSLFAGPMAIDTRHCISFTISAEDYASALRLHMRRYWARKLGPRIFVAAVFAACFLAAIVSRFHPLWTSAAIGAGIGAVCLPLFTYFVLLQRQARKIYSQQKTMQSPVDASWSKDAYSAATATVTGVTPWCDYYGWSADEKMVLLMQSPVLFQMVPRHALSAEQADDLIAQLEHSGLHRV